MSIAQDRIFVRRTLGNSVKEWARQLGQGFKNAEPLSSTQCVGRSWLAFLVSRASWTTRVDSAVVMVVDGKSGMV